MKFFEDMEIGDKTTFGSHTFSREEIIEFASQFDPQPFHLDDKAAEESHFGALCASGWNTSAAMIRAIVDHNQREEQQAKDSGVPYPEHGPSPGFKDLKWLKPVYVDDTITYSAVVHAKRESASRPKWGIITNRLEAHNQKGDKVMEIYSSYFLQRRSSLQE